MIENILPFPLKPEVYLSGNYLVIDFETTSIDHGDPRNENNHLVLGVWKEYHNWELVEAQSFTQYTDIYLASRLKLALSRVDFYVAHNTKFECGWMRRMGILIENHLNFCTMLGEYTLLGNNRSLSVGLDATTERYGLQGKKGMVTKLIHAGVCPSLISTGHLLEYCENDVDITNELFKKQLEKLNELNLLPVVFTRCISVPVLSDIESRGMHLDKQLVIEENAKYEQEYNATLNQIREFATDTNFNSPKQVAELLYDRLGFDELKDRRGNPLRTAADGRRTDEETINKLKATNKRQRRFIALYRELNRVNTILSKNLHFFRGIVEDTEDHVFYGNLNQAITQTHRLSSTSIKRQFKSFAKKKGVQLQNLPRILKKLFNARKKGWLINERDSSQLEFRVAVNLGRDDRGLADIVNGVDVHQRTSDTLTAAGEPTNRQDAKSRTFKPLYGGSSGTKAEQAYYDEFKKRYPGIIDAQERWKSEVEKTKQLVTATGLIFYWPDTKWEGSSRNPYLRNTTSICNFPVQSLATADIIPVAVTLMWYMIKLHQLQSFIINTIHDSTISEVHPDEVKQFDEIGSYSFTDGVVEYLDKIYNIEFFVPLDSDSKYGTHWGS